MSCVIEDVDYHREVNVFLSIHEMCPGREKGDVWLRNVRGMEEREKMLKIITGKEKRNLWKGEEWVNRRKGER